MQILAKCPKCDAGLPVSAAEAPAAIKCGGCGRDMPLVFTDALLTDPVSCREFSSAEAARARYRAYLTTRLRAPRDFVAEAIRARDELLREPARRLSARR